MSSKFYKAGSAKHWKGRVDENEGQNGLRWHQVIQPVDIDNFQPNAGKTAFTIIGFCSDEGVSRNKGRNGAVDGPVHLRETCASLAWQFNDKIALYDAGNVMCHNYDLESAHVKLQEVVSQILKKGAVPIVLGGGHETAWGSYMGLRKAYNSKVRIGIINFDAHFDLRKTDNGATSGTPFWQMAEWCKEHNSQFSYCCIGIQQHANIEALFDRANELGVKYFLAEDLMHQKSVLDVIEQLQGFIEKQDLIYVSIDLDGFDAAYAPGVSAPAVMGMQPSIIVPLLNYIVDSGKLALFDICELNPKYDVDNLTAKLGATLIFKITTKLVKRC